MKDETAIAKYAAAASAVHLDTNKHIERLKQSKSSISDATYTYDVQISFGGLLFAVLQVDFSTSDGVLATYFGMAGGLMFGAGTTWGSATMNVDVTTLSGDTD